MTFLEIQGLTKIFEAAKPAVDDVSFSVDEGEIICLLGPSGCGKTTLLRMIAGLETPDAGDVQLAGESIIAVPPHERDFGMMFQDFALFPHKNVFDNVAFGLQMRGVETARIASKVADMLELVDLIGFDSRDISQLSGGEQQRVALARSLARGPRLLMLDEPLGALDRALRERLMLELRDILKRVGVTAITVTHDQTEAFAIADRIAVMNAGQIEQLDTPETVYSQPASPFIARFLGFTNLLEGTVRADSTVLTKIGEFPMLGQEKLEGESVMVLIKPDAAKIMINRQSSIVNCQFEGVITAISFRGRYYQVWVEAVGESLMFEVESVVGWTVGSEVKIQIDVNDIITY